MKRDDGSKLALGAILAIAAVSTLSASRYGSMAKGRPSPQQIAQGRIKRVLKRAADQGRGAGVSLQQISADTGYSMSELMPVAHSMAKSGGYYIEDGQIGKVSQVRQKLIAMIKRNLEKNPELAVRTTDMTLRLMPGGGEITSLFALTSPADVLAMDVRMAAEALGYPTPENGKELQTFAQIYLDHLRSRRFFKMSDDPDHHEDFNIDQAASVWGDDARYLGWVEETVRNMIHEGVELERATTNMSNRWSHIMDWANTERADLTGMSVNDANAASDEWHRANRDRANAQKINRLKRQGKWFDCPDGIHPIKGEVVFEHDNGWAWQEMKTKKELMFEGNTSGKGGGCLHHCIGSSSQYFDGIASGRYRNFSLRTPDNKSILTMTIEYSNGRPSGIKELKGLDNRPAASPVGGGRVHGTMRRLGMKESDQDNFLDQEALLVEEFLREMDFPRSGHQYSSVSARLREIENRKRAAGRDGSPNQWPHYERTLAGYQRKDRGGRRRTRRQRPALRPALRDWWNA
jgi:hypothetical protein